MRALIIVLFWFLVNSEAITLKNNGYEGIVLTISDKIPENPELLHKIKEWLTEASAKLYIATKKQLYLRDITIRVPLNWTNDGQYTAVSESSLKNVHIKIDVENPRFGQNPYTYGGTGCGNPGQFIHFTPKVILDGNSGDYGNIGMVFVHEWGHFRWGLMDEYPSFPDLRTGQHFYTEGGTWKPVRCTNEVDGVAVNKHTNEGCRLTEETGKPETDCIFKPYNDNRSTAKASIMGHSFIPSIAYFCDDTPDNPETHHNSLAPNFHNVVCGGKSSWEIMRKHEDFKNISESEAIEDTTPTLRVVQTVSDRICLVIDVSGSMANLIAPTRNAVALLIKYVIPNTAYIGIVKFSSSATLLKNMTEITSEAIRDDLISHVPNTTGGSTSIGAGLHMALNTLTGLGKATGSVIYLATDGQENTSPNIADVLPSLMEQGVIVHTLAITSNADSKIAGVSRDTGGSSYFYSHSLSNSTALVDALTQPFAESSSDPIIRILSSPVSSSQNEVFDTTFVIDDSIGRETVIQFTASDVNGVNLTVTSEGDAYTTIGTSADPGVIAIKLPGKASVGEYTVSVTSNQKVSGTLLTQSKSAELGSDTIQMNAWTTSLNMNYSVDVQFPVFVSIQKGNVPVSNAEVTVFIENEKGKTSSLTLKDNGIGADMLANDGIYSGFVLPTLISSDGRHSLKITAQGVNSSIIMPQSRAPGFSDENIQLVYTENPISPFMRVALANEVLVTNHANYDSAVDRIPPSPITTLDLSRVNNKNNTFTVTWKAVGDDFDTGRAARYDFRISKNYTELANNIDDQDTIEINLMPREAGNDESFTFMLDSNEEKETYFIAIRTLDESNNTGEISNILSVSILSKESPWRQDTPVPIVVEETDAYFDNNQNVFLFGIISGATFLVAACIAINVFIFFRKGNKPKEII